MEYTKINPLALAITVSVLLGLSSFFIGLVAFVIFGNKPIIGMIQNIYLSYNSTLANACLGAAIVFITAFIVIYIVTWVYNFLLDYLS